MAAPTNAANVKKALANSEPSTHGPKQTSLAAPHMSAFGGKADMTFCGHMSPFDPSGHPEFGGAIITMIFQFLGLANFA
jgi:hypothetical protein